MKSLLAYHASVYYVWASCLPLPPGPDLDCKWCGQADGDFMPSKEKFQTFCYVDPNLCIVLYIIRFAYSPSAAWNRNYDLTPSLLLVNDVVLTGLPKLLRTRMVALAAVHPVVADLTARHTAVARVSEPAVNVLRRRAGERVRCGGGLGEGRVVDNARVREGGHGGAGDGGNVRCLWGGEVRSEDVIFVTGNARVRRHARELVLGRHVQLV